MSAGTRTIYTGGRRTLIVRSGEPTWKVGGATVDWTSVPAASGSDTTLADGQVIPAGVQYIRYGTVMCRLTSGANAGKFAPYNAGGSAGEENLTPGDCYLLPYTIRSGDLQADNPGLIDGGDVYPERITDLTGNPGIADLITAFPRVNFGATD